MDYPTLTAVIMGIVVEGLGLASLVMTFTFWSHNRKYQDKNNKMPLWIPIFTYCFYLIVVLWLNVLLDYLAGIQVQKVAVVALFSLLSVPAGLLLAVQTIHTEWNTDHSRQLSERKQSRFEKLAAKSQEERKETEKPQNLPRDWRNLRPTLSDNQVEQFAALAAYQVRHVMEKYGVSERTVENWRNYARAEVEQKGLQ